MRIKIKSIQKLIIALGLPIAFIIVAVHSPLASAQESVAAPLHVKWYQPEVGESKRKNWVRVILSGTTTPGARALVSSKHIPVILPNKKIRRIKTKAALKSKRYSTADNKGYFEIHLELPTYPVQLPLKVYPPRGVKQPARSYQFNLIIEKQKVQLHNAKHLERSPAFQKKYGIWFGSGINYLAYTQQTQDIPSDLEFQTFKGPSAFAKGWIRLTDQMDLIATAKMSPGAAGSSNSVQVANGDYNWLIFGLEGSYYPHSWRFKLGKNTNSILGFRVGLQHHIVPFIARTGTSEQEAEITTNSMTMMTGGLIYTIAPEEKISYEIFMRYQYPLATGDIFSIDPKFAFDGSVGATYQLNNDWKLGVFWYGQWHEYSFTHTDKYFQSQNEPAEIQGDQSLFFSNIELRLGYEFN